jgi:hypothetical protein
MNIDDYGDILLGTSSGGKRKRIGRLNTAADIAAYIARCIREAERTGKVKENHGKVMMAKELLRAIESAERGKTKRRKKDTDDMPQETNESIA